MSVCVSNIVRKPRDNGHVCAGCRCGERMDGSMALTSLSALSEWFKGEIHCSTVVGQRTGMELKCNCFSAASIVVFLLGYLAGERAKKTQRELRTRNGNSK